MCSTVYGLKLHSRIHQRPVQNTKYGVNLKVKDWNQPNGTWPWPGMTKTQPDMLATLVTLRTDSYKGVENKCANTGHQPQRHSVYRYEDAKFL